MEGLPWSSSAYDSVLPMKGVWIQSLVRELDPPCHNKDWRPYVPQLNFLKIFFWCGPFLKSLLNLLQYCFCFRFWFFGHKVCGVLTPWPGIEPAPPALKGGVLTTESPGKSLINKYFKERNKNRRYRKRFLGASFLPKDRSLPPPATSNTQLSQFH